ncbi:MAG: NADH-quinone oxidoreductase subunit A [Deltaproteobacteria bacterium]|nr:NADH-quinone oxidoreductase subunit A [Deltaproteobacteria bacterium]
MDHPFFPILIVLGVGIAFSALFLTLSALIGPKKKSAAKMLPYECGIDPVGNAREPVNVKFSLVAMLFILFDIEAVFLFPWAVLYKKFIAEGAGLFMLIEMGIFIVILALGLLFVWRKGALEWK